MEAPWETAKRLTEERFGCQCLNKILVRTRDSLNRAHYRQMCIRCYELDWQAVSIKGMDERAVARIVEWDEDMEAKREERRKRRREYEQGLTAQYTEANRDKMGDYYDSPQWARKRSLVMRRANGVCEGCGEEKARAVHHLTYERFGDEMLFDLVALCEGCHLKLHPQHKTAAA